jgi:hypothetical protein
VHGKKEEKKNFYVFPSRKKNMLTAPKAAASKRKKTSVLIS